MAMDRLEHQQYNGTSLIRTLIFATLLPLVRAQSPPMETTTATQADGSVILTIQNHAASTLTAYFYKHTGWGRYPHAPENQVLEMGYKDAAIDGPTNPIPPNQKIILRFDNGEVAVLAALWSDGSSYGDPEWISRFQQRRIIAQQHIDAATYVLQNALDTGMDTPALLRQLQTIVDELVPPNVNGDDIGVARLYYMGALQHLTDHALSKNATGTPPHLTDREIIQADLTILERQRARLLLYR
jgi:hypothetical protein